MATGTGGIATKADCNTIAPGAFSGDLTKCPTKDEIKATGILDVTGTYAGNQCVKFSDVKSAFSLSVSPTVYTAVIGGGSFILNITSNTAWEITYPSWCVGERTGIGSVALTIVVASNAGNTPRSGYITVTTTTGEPISVSCRVNQEGLPLYGGSVTFAVKFINITPYSRNVSGNVDLIMNGVNLGSVYVSGTVPGNETEGMTLGGGEVNAYSSVNKTVPIDFGFTDYSGDSCGGNMDFNVSGNGTGGLSIGNWFGSPAGARCTGDLSFINSGSGSVLIYAVFTITSI